MSARSSDQGLGFMLIRAMEAHEVLDIMALTLLLLGGRESAELTLQHAIGDKRSVSSGEFPRDFSARDGLPLATASLRARPQ